MQLKNILHTPLLSLLLLTSTVGANIADDIPPTPPSGGGLLIEPQGGRTSCTRKTVNGDNVSVHYRGTLLADGTEFDKSANRGQPIQFVLGSGRVIRGWEQGLLDMCVGEKRKLTIPPELGYGKFAIGPIPPDSTLVFETELVAIEGVEPEPELEPEAETPEEPEPQPEQEPVVAETEEQVLRDEL